MKRKIKVLAYAFVLTGVLGTSVMCTSNVSQAFVIEADAAETRAYIIEWRYKVIDGHLYKRLYNATTEEWIGDWILME